MKIHKFQDLELKSLINTPLLPVSVAFETGDLRPGRDPFPSSGERPEAEAWTRQIWGRLGHQSGCVEEMIFPGRGVR